MFIGFKYHSHWRWTVFLNVDGQNNLRSTWWGKKEYNFVGLGIPKIEKHVGKLSVSELNPCCCIGLKVSKAVYCLEPDWVSWSLCILKESAAVVTLRHKRVIILI